MVSAKPDQSFSFSADENGLCQPINFVRLRDGNVDRAYDHGEGLVNSIVVPLASIAWSIIAVAIQLQGFLLNLHAKLNGSIIEQECHQRTEGRGTSATMVTGHQDSLDCFNIHPPAAIMEPTAPRMHGTGLATFSLWRPPPRKIPLTRESSTTIY